MLCRKPAKSRQLLLGEEGVLLFWGEGCLFLKKTCPQEEIADWYKLYHRHTRVPMSSIGNGHKESGKVCLNHYCCRDFTYRNNEAFSR